MESSEQSKEGLVASLGHVAEPTAIGPGGDHSSTPVTPEDVSQDTLKEGSKDTSQEAPEDKAIDAPKDLNQETPDVVSTDATLATSQGAQKEGASNEQPTDEEGRGSEGNKESGKRGEGDAGNAHPSPEGADAGVTDPLDGGKEESSTKKTKGNIHTLLERDLTHLSRSERTTLYEAGIKLHSNGEEEEALACLLGAITGLKEGSAFSDLPKCLHAVADIYFDKKEYEKAVYFIQAEKMYYETALIDIVSVEKHADDEKGRRQSQGSDEDANESGVSQEEAGKESTSDGALTSENKDDDLSPDARKGQEFENLARLCLKEGKLQLALDYCGKATKMYQAVYGEGHPVTVAALDLFTVIYADVGKKLYSDAMQKFEKEEETLSAEKSHDMSSQSPDTELRHRGPSIDKEVADETSQSVDQSQPFTGEFEPATETERDDWVMTVLLMLIFFLVTVFVAIVISSIYCYNNTRSTYCAQTRGDLNYWYMYVRHIIHDIRKGWR